MILIVLRAGNTSGSHVLLLHLEPLDLFQEILACFAQPEKSPFDIRIALFKKSPCVIHHHGHPPPCVACDHHIYLRSGVLFEQRRPPAAARRRWRRCSSSTHLAMEDVQLQDAHEQHKRKLDEQQLDDEYERYAPEFGPGDAGTTKRVSNIETPIKLSRYKP